MLSEKTSYLLRKLDVENSVIASYAGCTPANFCRLKSGSRKYSENSTTVKKFTEGVCSYCSDNGKLGELCAVIGAENDEQGQLSQLLRAWLFKDGGLPEEIQDNEISRLFGQKLCSLMKLAHISNSKLSKALSIDASYVSRMRSGARIPKKSTGMMVKLCSVLAERITELEKTAELCGLMGIDDAEKNELSDMIYVWLYDRSMPENVRAVRSFIEQMSVMTHPGLMDIPLPHLPEVPETASYYGDRGLQQAVVRFLKDVIKNKSSELKLYSDSNINWMTGDFRPLWAAMMAACLKNGTRIRMIHNVDRSVNEMIQAIISWMPLYFTGIIEPYYSSAPVGHRFTCSIFIDPKRACVQSFGVRDMSDDAKYDYVTDEAGLDRAERAFDTLMAKCSPLLTIKPLVYPKENDEVYSIGSVRLCFSGETVTVSKLDEPPMSFSFSYPPICRAFRSFADTIREAGKDMIPQNR